MSADTTPATPTGNTHGFSRLLRVFFSHSRKSIREQADVFLFVCGLLVEYALLFLVFTPHAQAADTNLGSLAHYLVLLALYFALFVHQFLIFRNYSLHHSLSNGRVQPLELLICLLFGVLTGEVGYLIVLSLCAFPSSLTQPSFVIVPLTILSAAALLLTTVLCIRRLLTSRSLLASLAIITIGVGITVAALYFVPPSTFALTKTETSLDWYFAKHPLHLPTPDETEFTPDTAVELINWFMHGLGVVLKAVFTVGAIAMSALVLLWDILCGEGFDESANAIKGDTTAVKTSYRVTKVFFYVMDVLACLVWTAILGMILPNGFVTTPADSWTWVLTLSLLYGALAFGRLAFATQTLASLSNEAAVEKTVI